MNCNHDGELENQFWTISSEKTDLQGGGRKEGPKTAKPHKKIIKNRNTALKFTEIPKPQAAVVKIYSPSIH